MPSDLDKLIQQGGVLPQGQQPQQPGGIPQDSPLNDLFSRTDWSGGMQQPQGQPGQPGEKPPGQYDPNYRENEFMSSGFLPGSRQLGMGANEGEAYYGDPSGEYQGIQTDIQNWWNAKVARVHAPAYTKQADGTYKVSDPSAVNLASRGLQEGIGAVLDVMNLGAKGVKAYLGAGQAMENIADASASWLPDLNKGDAWNNQVLKALPMYQGYNVLRALTGSRKLTSDEVIKEMDTNIQASRIAYSAFVDPALREEFKRRYEAGENPIKLEAELMNPWYEMAGEFVLDPMNLLDFLGKGAGAATKLEQVTRRYAQAAPEAVKLTDAIRAASRGEQIAKDINIAEETAKVAKRASEIEQGMKNIDSYVKFGAGKMFTATAKRAFISDTVGNIGRVIMGTFRDNPDEAAEVIKAMVKIGSGKADEVAEAAEILGKTQTADVSRILFSQAGMETSVIMRKMLIGADGALDEAGFLKAISNSDFEKLDELFNKKMSTALADMFPTVNETLAKNKKLIEQADKLKAVGQVDAAEKMLEGVQEVSPAAQAINKLHDTAQAKGMKFLHDKMSQVYISLQPGVGVKNVLGGLTHIATDLGPGTAWRAGQESAKALGGVATGKSLSEVSNIYDVIREWTGGHDIAAASRGVSGMFEDVKDPLKIGDAMSATEKAMSAAIVADSVEKTIRGALKASFKQLAPEINALQGGEALLGKVEKFKGDWAKAIAEYKQDRAIGYIKSWQDWKSWMNPSDVQRIESAGMNGAIEKALQEPTLDGAMAKLDDIVKDITKKAAGITEEVPPPSTDEYVQELTQAVQSKTMTKNEQTTFALKKIAYEEARRTMTEAGRKYMEYVAQKNPQAADALRRLQGAMDAEITRGGAAALAKQNTDQIRSVASNAYELTKGKDPDLLKAWEMLTQDRTYLDLKNAGLKLPDQMPATAKEMNDLIWRQYYTAGSDLAWMKQRDAIAQIVKRTADQAGALIGETPEMVTASEIFKPAIQKMQYSDMVAKSAYDGKHLRLSMQEGIRAIAEKLGISTVSEKGVSHDQRLLNIFNQGREEGQKWAKLSDVPDADAKRILMEYAERKKIPTDQVSWVDKLAIPRASDSDEFFSSARAAAENMDGVAEQVSRVKQQLQQVWGKGTPVPKLSADEEKILQSLGKQGAEHVAQARVVAAEIASQARDFALVNYAKKTYFDVAAAYLMPYAFWYSRTYPNWLKRVVTSPATVAAYAKYKNYLGKAHANLPDWWKYNLSTNDIPGMQSDHPLYFNLEATLNPMNGLTGVDFTDPEKVIGDEGSAMRMWTSALDSMGKFGPAPHTLLTLGTAYALYAQNEKDAASRWAGRIIPQTATFKALSSYFGKPIEVDPGVILFGGESKTPFSAVDPYEARRVGRALGEMIQENPSIEAQAIEAARTHEGPLWEEAQRRAWQGKGFDPNDPIGSLARNRAGMTIQSFFAGTGFKGRTPEDIKIDQFYTDYRNLWAQKDNLSPYEFATAMQSMKQEYPFMDTLMLSKKDGIDRDRGYAYAVMTRIPPNQMDDIAQAVGLDKNILTQFYESKGALDKWSETDRQRFMAAMVDIGTMLDIPTDATREEWTQVKGEYNRMNDKAEQMFGKDIMDKVQVYYSTDDTRVKDAYIKLHPEVGQYMQWKSEYITNNTLLSVYYNGVGQYEKYFDGQLRAQAEKQFGPDFFGTLSDYYDMLNRGEDTKAYLKANPNIKQYWAMRDKWKLAVQGRLANFASLLPEGQNARLQQHMAEQQNLSQGQQGVLDYVQQQQNPITWEQIAPQIPTDLQNALANYYNGKEIPYSQNSRLERLAKKFGIDVDQLLLIYGQVLPQSQ